MSNTHYGPLWTLSAVKDANRDAGQRYFSRNTMRFFHSRSVGPVYPCHAKDVTYFVTSERQDNNHPRLYSVRVIDWDTARVGTVGKFQDYTTSRTARARAAELARSQDDDRTEAHAGTMEKQEHDDLRRKTPTHLPESRFG